LVHFGTLRAQSLSAPLMSSLSLKTVSLLAFLALGLGATAIACSSPGLGSLPEDQLEGDNGGAAGGPTQGAIDCHAEGVVEGTFGSCRAADSENDCQRCVQATCCTEQETCNATAPDSSCSYGSTLFESRVVEGGEIGCMMECFAARESAGELEGTESDITACSAQCGASECQGTAASAPTIALAECILGTNSDDGGCRAECGFAQ
jgi:hypothetical protein